VIEIVKDRLDLGLLTARPEVLEFWRDEIGLELDHVLPVGRGHVQHRFDLAGSVLKLNLLSSLDATARSGIAELLIARPGLGEAVMHTDPDGNRVRLVPPGEEGVTQIGIRIRVGEASRSRRHYRDVLGLEEEVPGRVRCGASVLLIQEAPDAPVGVVLPVLGWAYLTVQVRDCDAEVARVEALGASILSRPRNLGEVARMAMVGDPDGNPLEVSQRASLVGPLPPDPPDDGRSDEAHEG